MIEYFLPSHVHVGRRGDALVFLDLKQDDYVLVSGDNALLLQELFSHAHPDRRTPEVAAAARELVESGLLTTDRHSGRQIRSTSLEPVFDRLVDPEELSEIHPKASHVWRFATACSTAALHLRFRSLAEIIRVVEQRKRTHRNLASTDIAKARELTAIFMKLRYFFPLNYLCLYDSLALLEFLAPYRIFPTWVFGITLEPWAAHCWIQEAGFTFTEDAEEAASYTPVMAV